MACIDLPAFPLQLLLRECPEWREMPAAVVDRDRPTGTILWVNEKARAERILPGMRYAAGLSLARELRAGVVSEGEIAAALTRVTETLHLYTPEVEPMPAQPGVFWMGAGGLSLLHATLDDWGTTIRGELQKEGLEGRVVVGFSRFGSFALAKAGGVGTLVVATPDDETRLVRDIPLARLPVDPGFRDTLLMLGVETIGGLLDLPPAELQRRFPPEVSAFVRMARGDLWSPLAPEPLQEPLARKLVLDAPESDAERLGAAAAEMLRDVLRDLARRGRCLSALVLTLVQDRSGEHVERLEPAVPTLDLDQLLELVHLRLRSRAFSGGVIELGLDAEWTVATTEQLALFAERPKRNLEAAGRALAAVRADLGEDAVVRGQLREAHLPEARFEWDRFDQIKKPGARKVYLPPLVRRVEPQPSLLRRASRDPFEESIGPYLVSGGWWRRPVEREYRYVRTAGGQWLWVYHDRLRRRWYRQGEVG